MNTGPRGGALPVELRIYTLRSLQAATRAAYEDFHGQAEEVLGDELVTPLADRLMVYPASTWRARFKPDAEARYLLCAAFFVQPTGASWRAAIELPGVPESGVGLTRDELAARPVGYTIRLVESRISIEALRAPVDGASPQQGARAKRPRRIPTGARPPRAPDLPSTPQKPSTPRAPRPPARPRLGRVGCRPV